MTEENQNPVAGDGNGKIAHPQKIYIKDASFESPGSPDIFTHEWKPNLEVEIDSQTRQIADDTYDVVMKVTAKAKVEGSTAFLAEVQQAGIFLLKGFEPDRLQRLQNVFCLRILYPYATAALADLIEPFAMRLPNIRPRFNAWVDVVYHITPRGFCGVMW